MKLAGLTSLAAYTHSALIAPRLRERDTAGIISELSHLLQENGIVPDVLPFYHTALNQELLASSALDCGIALPHARLGGVKRLQFAFGRCPEAVIWGAKGPWAVRFVFLVAVPATDAARYLDLLSSFARLGQQPELLHDLETASGTEAILAVLHRIPMRGQ